MNPSLDRFKEVLLCAEPGCMAVVIQDHPDPDAMASAVALSFLVSHLRPDLSCEIYYGGSVSHPQNRTMVNVLGLPLKKTPPNLAKSDFCLVALVDAANTGQGNVRSTDMEPDLVFDHHRAEPKSKSLLWKDIRAVGACSTLLASMLRELVLSSPPLGAWQGLALSDIATALLVGIKTDTADLTSPTTTPADHEAFSWLLGQVERNKLTQILNYGIPHYIYKLKAEAFQKADHQGHLIIACLGDLPSSQRDAIPILADDLLRLEGIETVVVYAVVEDRLSASVRTTNDALEVHGFCQQVFGEGNGGGKLGCGGASVPLGFFAQTQGHEGARSHLLEAIRLSLHPKIAQAANGE